MSLSNRALQTIKLILHPEEKNLGGFSVRRTLPSMRCKQIGPWVFFDHMGPATFAPGEGLNVRPHPHIGIATVTFLFEGEVLHRDSLGNTQLIHPGAINLMVSGRGIVHSERERPEIKSKAHRAHGLQLWLALPEANEEMAPEFIHYAATEIPEVTLDNGSAKVLMGAAFGVSSPVKTFAETLYVEARLQPGARLELPAAEERAIYVIEGAVNIGGQRIETATLAVLNSGSVVIESEASTHIALIGGEKLSRRYIDWNFVSSRKQRLEQAKNDWREGRFPKVPGDDQEFIPLPV